MIVYVESNFILEMALGQESRLHADSILSLAESGSIGIAFPSFAISEPFSTLAYRHTERRRLSESINRESVQLRRSAPHTDEAAALENVSATLIKIAEKEFSLLDSVVDRLLSVGRCVELSRHGFPESLRYRDQYGLSPQDSIVYSSVVEDLKRRPADEVKCFTSRNV